MNRLAKICEVLALKRSRAEREIAQRKMNLQALDERLAAMEVQIFDKSADLFSGATSNDPIGDAKILEQWRDMTMKNMRALRIERKNINAQLSIEKQLLKEILVKEDIVNSNLMERRRLYAQKSLENEGSARLETWIVSRSCGS